VDLTKVEQHPDDAKLPYAINCVLDTILYRASLTHMSGSKTSTQKLHEVFMRWSDAFELSVLVLDDVTAIQLLALEPSKLSSGTCTKIADEALLKHQDLVGEGDIVFYDNLGGENGVKTTRSLADDTITDAERKRFCHAVTRRGLAFILLGLTFGESTNKDFVDALRRRGWYPENEQERATIDKLVQVVIGGLIVVAQSDDSPSLRAHTHSHTHTHTHTKPTAATLVAEAEKVTRYKPANAASITPNKNP